MHRRNKSRATSASFVYRCCMCVERLQVYGEHITVMLGLELQCGRFTPACVYLHILTHARCISSFKPWSSLQRWDCEGEFCVCIYTRSPRSSLSATAPRSCLSSTAVQPGSTLSSFNPGAVTGKPFIIGELMKPTIWLSGLWNYSCKLSTPTVFLTSHSLFQKLLRGRSSVGTAWSDFSTYLQDPLAQSWCPAGIVYLFCPRRPRHHSSVVTNYELLLTFRFIYCYSGSRFRARELHPRGLLQDVPRFLYET